MHERRDEVVVDDDGLVDLLLRIELDQLVRNALRVVVVGPVDEAGEGRVDRVAAEAKRRLALAADDEPAHVLALAAQAPLEREARPEHLRVEAACEAAVAGDGDDRDRLHVALLEERQVPDGRARARDALHQLSHRVRVRAHRLDPRLGAPQAGARDELQRLRDLARVPDRADPALQVLDRCHQQPPCDWIVLASREKQATVGRRERA